MSTKNSAAPGRQRVPEWCAARGPAFSGHGAGKWLHLRLLHKAHGQSAGIDDQQKPQRKRRGGEDRQRPPVLSDCGLSPRGRTESAPK